MFQTRHYTEKKYQFLAWNNLPRSYIDHFLNIYLVYDCPNSTFSYLAVKMQVFLTNDQKL